MHSIHYQKDLKLISDDCKRLFDVGIEHIDCFDKPVNVFGIDEQKQQWQPGYCNPWILRVITGLRSYKIYDVMSKFPADVCVAAVSIDCLKNNL